MIPFTRDLSEAYIQSLTLFKRDVSMNAPKELGIQNVLAILVVKSLYAASESGLHWYITYMWNHIYSLSIWRARAYPFVVYRNDEEQIYGLMMHQVDVSLEITLEPLLSEEKRFSSAFRCEFRNLLAEVPTTFNGPTSLRSRKETFRSPRKTNFPVFARRS